MVTRDVSKCRVGQVRYTPWCDAHGKVIDDGTISRLDEHTFRPHERSRTCVGCR
jgi:aminomethyltransferase